MQAKRFLVALLLLTQTPLPVAAEENVPSSVAAEEQPLPARTPSNPPTSAETPPGWTESRATGWLLIGSSLVLGAALSAGGLGIDCGEDLECRKDATLLVWGGFGVASVGSMFGFVVLERAESAEAGHSPSGLTLSVGGHF